MYKGLTPPAGQKLPVFLELRRGPLELRREFQGPAPVASGEATLRASCQAPLGIPPLAAPGLQASSAAEDGA